MRKLINWQCIAAWGTMLLLWVMFALVVVHYADAATTGTFTAPGAVQFANTTGGAQ